MLRNVFNAFPVRQGAGDVGAVRETIQRLREGHLLNIYPEGARTSDGRIAALQKGVALIIRRAKVPVIPTAVIGSYQAWRMGRRWCRPWPIRVEYGPPMHLHDRDADEILATIDETLRRMVCRLRGRVACGKRTDAFRGSLSLPAMITTT